MKHSEIDELLGAFALDALDSDEKLRIEDHLRECPRCRTEVANHRETAALLAPAASAPDKLWERIAGALEPAPPRLDLVRPSRARPLTVRAGLIAGAAAGVLAGFMGFKVNELNNRLDQINSLQGAAQAALMNPRSSRVQLTAANKPVAHLVLLRDGQGYLVENKLRALDSDRTYQLWGLVGQEKISLGVLGKDPEVAAFKFAGRIDGFALTEEVAGGVQMTKSDPIAVGYL